ncbi:hypothetical protein JI721_06495 [Alicyclobacillus cycloheptanicus]|uniref:HKD family nuclease n=1 Tax=Alicyclobacillus cycloheptanicus TaxID=1457 RepID=A0ABT9XMT0_9BACL|nr:phospholipase D-like domain-containing protein [Alicyclobacillus cycloheptanicus]MDQ0191624.1 HKD family nuclease [Alicyclobacillus cycloheptanicus]WDM02439.1 hypothetical protein JI721_06495 [Alicyclobacillus cycloheptanicus]
MKQPGGIYEELQLANKTYPQPNQRSTVVHPNLYAQFLTQQIARDIGAKLQRLAHEQRYDEMLEMTQSIQRQVNADERSSFHSPLSTIHYRFDDDYIPTFPDMYLTHPAFISNRSSDPYALNFFKSLKFELQTADKMYFVVSFIRWSGLQLLLRTLDECMKKGKPIRILTTNYMYVTEPKALRNLMQHENVELRLYDTSTESFHTKAYIFERESGLHTVIIGSSNLSHAALRTGHEWNVKLPHAPHLPVFESARKHFDEVWNMTESIPVTIEVLEQYEANYRQYHLGRTTRDIAASNSSPLFGADPKPDYLPSTTFHPNKMQSKALLALDQTRKNGLRKGVVIAATGTGKTYPCRI